MGEKQGDREAMDRVHRELIGQHNPTTGRRWTPQEAEQASRESMRRVDARLREQGKR